MSLVIYYNRGTCRPPAGAGRAGPPLGTLEPEAPTAPPSPPRQDLTWDTCPHAPQDSSRLCLETLTGDVVREQLEPTQRPGWRDVRRPIRQHHAAVTAATDGGPSTPQHPAPASPHLHLFRMDSLLLHGFQRLLEPSRGRRRHCRTSSRGVESSRTLV